MDPPALVRGGDRAVLIVQNRLESPPWQIGIRTSGQDPAGPASSFDLPPPLVSRLRSLGEPVACDDIDLGRSLESAGVRWFAPSVLNGRRAREIAFGGAWPDFREACIAWTESEVVRRLASPEETLITLTREEERVERSIRRDEGAAEEFPGSGRSELVDYRRSSANLLGTRRTHHVDLARAVDRLAVSVAPNLSALVGPRVAARLIARAGGLSGLARSPGSRIQLLGARRRPARRGPRFGVLYRSVVEADVPELRRGAYARSLAALAAIAARADFRAQADLTRTLLARRDRRKEVLRRGGR